MLTFFRRKEIDFMQSYGIYLYAPSSIFMKVKDYIDANYNSITVKGASDFKIFKDDFFMNQSARHLRSVAIISTQPYSEELANEYEAVVTQINSLQCLFPEHLIVTVLVMDEKFDKCFDPLRKYTDINIARISGEGIKNDIIDKIIVAPIIRNAPKYMSGEVEVTPIPQVQTHNPTQLHEVKPVKIEVGSSIDVPKRFESDATFTNTLKDIHEDLKNMELRLNSGDWTSQEIQTAMENLEKTNTVGNLEYIIESKMKDYASNLNERIENADLELRTYEEVYQQNQDGSIGEHINRLSVYKDRLVGVKDLCKTQNKNSFFKAIQNELIEQGQHSMEEFQNSLKEIEEMKSIKNSEQKIEELKIKRRDLYESVSTYQNKLMKQFNAIQAEVSVQEKQLITEVTNRKDEYEIMYAQYNKDNTSSQLREQLITDRETIVILTREIKSLQDSRTQFVDSCRQLINGYKQIISLDTVLIKEYDAFTNKLKNSKKVEVVADDILGTKLEGFIGIDGVGKTCVAVNYAVSCMKSGKTVCLIDLDIETPELQYYLSDISKIQDLADFVNMETSVDAMSELKVHDGSCYITNPYPEGAIGFRLENCDQVYDMFTNIIDKLEILARVFDKIIVILPHTLDEYVKDFYLRCGKWFYVVDLNPSNIDKTAMLFKELRSAQSSKYYKFVINKYTKAEIGLIGARLGMSSSFFPITIPVSHSLTDSKLEGVVSCRNNTGLLKTFNFK